jgi:hypothetical protein
MSYSKTKWIQITVPLTPDEHEKIKARAEQEDRSMANYIRTVILPKPEKRPHSSGGKA